MTAIARTTNKPPAGRAPLGARTMESAGKRLDAREVRLLSAQSVEHLHLDLTANGPKSN